MAELTQIQKTIAQQINFKELKFAKFSFMLDGANALIVSKGQKALKVIYDDGSDTYTVELYKFQKLGGVKEKKVETLVYWDQLQNLIQDHFKFEYVMESLFGVRTA